LIQLGVAESFASATLFAQGRRDSTPDAARAPIPRALDFAFFVSAQTQPKSQLSTLIVVVRSQIAFLMPRLVHVRSANVSASGNRLFGIGSRVSGSGEPLHGDQYRHALIQARRTFQAGPIRCPRLLRANPDSRAFSLRCARRCNGAPPAERVLHLGRRAISEQSPIPSLRRGRLEKGRSVPNRFQDRGRRSSAPSCPGGRGSPCRSAPGRAIPTAGDTIVEMRPYGGSTVAS